MDSRLSRWCDGFLEAGWLVAILTIPLFFNIHSERVFEPDKLAILRSLALLMVAAWLVGFIDRRGWREFGRLRFTDPDSIWHKPFVLPILALIVVYALATMFSINPRISWAGSYQRLQGTYTTLSYVVIFALMAAGLRSPEQVRRVVTVVIVTSIPVALYGMLQHFGHDPLPWGGDVQGRVAGHMGNAIFIAAYLIMVIPLTLARIIDAFSNILGDEKMAASDVARSSIYIFILAVQLLTLYWSGSRGPLIGLGVGLFSFVLVLLVSLRDAARPTGDRRGHLRQALPAFLFLLPALAALFLSQLISTAAGPLVAFAFFFGVVALSVLAIFVLVAARRGWSWLWLGWILLTAFMAGWLLLFNIPSDRAAGWRAVPIVGGVFDALDEWRNLPVIGSYGRMLDPSDTTGREKSGRVRVLIWEGVIDLIRPHEPLEYPDGRVDPFNWLRPILGYGPESMYTAYNRFYPPELATVEARNASPDRSHNETFDTLVITGPVGLLAWQALYLTVVLFAFRYLGVVRSRRDSWVLIGLWVAGALLAAAIAVIAVDPVYLGVAVPTGVILGVIIYLIYYALFGRPEFADSDGAVGIRAPFAADRLLMNALVAAVLAHYVEIHFGIAISATRLYFFVYVALMFALGYRLRRQAAESREETPPPTAAPTRRDKRKRRTAVAPTLEAPPRSDWQNLVVPALLLTLMLALLGYGFTTYALPPDKIITGPADLSAAEVFRQSLLQNARERFIDSPFVLSLFVLSWVLGWLVFLGEMVKHGEIRLPTVNANLALNRQRAATGILLAMALGGVAARVLAPAGTVTAALGASLALAGAVACGATAAYLLYFWPASRGGVAVIALALIILAFPILVAVGFLSALVMIAGGTAILWLLWDGRWRQTLLPAAGVILASLLAGMLFIYLHAVNYRTQLFYRGREAAESTAVLRSLESSQAGGLLAFFLVFLLVVILLLAFALSWPDLRSKPRQRAASPVWAYAGLGVALLVVLFLIAQTNVRQIQADMIFKRGKPYDEQATRAAGTGADPAARRDAWDAAIAIYDAAINRLPTEDFYYLFLGRAYLERASLTQDAAEQADLLSRAERLLLQAQELNPLNTDHTANLARLNTRWYGVIGNEAERTERLDLAERYYREALTLSPQNSVIRNELARLVLELRGDCDQALALYDETTAIDPFYAQTFLARADAYLLCASGREEAERDEFYRLAAASLEEGLAINPANVRAWTQLAEVYRQLGDYERALAAVESARDHNEPVVFPPAEIDFLAAQIAADSGDTAEARALAERALTTAGAETAAQIQAFLDELP
jgi:tetratricopeptide (TPR) repeat protein